MCVRDSLHSSNIKILDDGKIAFGAIYEDRNWIKETFIGNAVEWKWYGCVAVVDLAKQEIVDSARTKSIKVRDRQSSAKDIWQDIDTHNFMRVKNNTIEVKLGEYTRTSLKYTPKPCVKYVDKISGIRNKLHQKDATIEVVTPETKEQNTTNVVLANKGKSGYGD